MDCDHHGLGLLGFATRWTICAVIVGTQIQMLFSSVKIFCTDYRSNPQLSGALVKPLERSSCTKRKYDPYKIGTGNIGTM